MSYTTEAIVRKQSPFKDTSNIGTTYIERAIDEADDIIDSMIGDIYDLPLASTPDMIQRISTTLAINQLLLDQRLNVEVASGVNVSEAVENAMSLLEDVQKRKKKLLDSSGDELTRTSLYDPVSYPDQTSTDAEDTEPLFEIDSDY